MHRFLVCILLLAAMAPAALAAPGADIAISMSDLDTARSVAIASDLMDRAEQAGHRVTMLSADHRLSRQISDIHRLIEDRPDYLVVAAVKAVGLGGAIRAAAEAGIGVILVDRLSTDARAEDVLAAVGVDAEWAGGACAAALAERLGDRAAKILEIQGEAGASTTNGFAKGFRDALCGYENLQIAGVVSGSFSREAAQQELLRFYEQNGAGFDAVFGHSDEEGLGAVGALFSLEGARSIPVVSIGGSDDAMRALAAGRLAACVQVTPYFADAVLEAIEADRAGEPVQALRLVRGSVARAADPYRRGY